MKKITRRDFLRTTAMTGAAAFTTCVAAQNMPAADACGLDKLFAFGSKNEETVDGTPIVVTTPVDSVEALKSAKPNQYYQSGTMRLVKLQDGIYHMDESTEEHPAGPTNNCSSMYLIVGRKTAALVDGGNGESAYGYYQNSAMKEFIHGLVGSKTLKVIISHSHGDHIGLFAHKDSYDIIPKDTPMYIGENDLDSLSQTVKDRYTISTLADGDTIEAGGHTLHVVNLPGHSDGSLLLIDYKNEVIFSGDTIGSGTVWLFYENNLKEFNYSIRRCAAIVANMKNPIFYAGHRWQQYESAASTASVCVEEMGKEYVLEMVDLMNEIKNGTYALCDAYGPDPAGENLAMYPHYDRNNDGIVPGIYSTILAAEGFISF